MAVVQDLDPQQSALLKQSGPRRLSVTQHVSLPEAPLRAAQSKPRVSMPETPQFAGVVQVLPGVKPAYGESAGSMVRAVGAAVVAAAVVGGGPAGVAVLPVIGCP